jgi:hypothetical protein
MTPEGKTKNRISKFLGQVKQIHGEVWWFMPVQNGMGRATLDYVGWFRGRAFAIEAKAPGKKPTPRQTVTAAEMMDAGAKVFVVDGSDASFEIMIAWFELAAP